MISTWNLDQYGNNNVIIVLKNNMGDEGVLNIIAVAFKMFFTKKYIKIIYFYYFLKIIFNISTLK